jgi:hypothetical protein
MHPPNGCQQSERIYAIAKVIFIRMSSHVSPAKVNDEAWRQGLEEFKKNPQRFPMIGVCVKTASEILDLLHTAD